MIANNFKKKLYPTQLKDEEEVGMFFHNLQIKSFELYMPVASKVVSENKRPHKRHFPQLLNYLTVRSATMEMARHPNLTDPDFNPGKVWHYSMVDVLK